MKTALLIIILSLISCSSKFIYPKDAKCTLILKADFDQDLQSEYKNRLYTKLRAFSDEKHDFTMDTINPADYDLVIQIKNLTLKDPDRYKKTYDSINKEVTERIGKEKIKYYTNINNTIQASGLDPMIRKLIDENGMKFSCTLSASLKKTEEQKELWIYTDSIECSIFQVCTKREQISQLLTLALLKLQDNLPFFKQ